jgi:hypothetical protein
MGGKIDFRDFRSKTARACIFAGDDNLPTPRKGIAAGERGARKAGTRRKMERRSIGVYATHESATSDDCDPIHRIAPVHWTAPRSI